ncbi:hypothetical protein EDB87DRAFT_1582345 [Lactarius vividus]|nr:hypothetical protein EDB87DRAFT_1582345 [Lactarius vividus]
MIMEPLSGNKEDVFAITVLRGNEGFIREPIITACTDYLQLTKISRTWAVNQGERCGAPEETKRSTKRQDRYYSAVLPVLDFASCLPQSQVGDFVPAERRKGGGVHLHSKAEKEYVIAASYAPASASHPSLQDASSATTTSQTPPAALPAPINLTVEPRQDRAYLASVFDTGTHPNHSSANLSSHSRTSDRLRSHSRESLYAPVSQQTRFSRAPHRQFGRGPSPSPSREQSRSPSPADRAHQFPRLETDITNLRPQARVDNTNHPTNLPSIASPAHAPLGPPSHGHRRRLSSTSVVVVGIVNPSTDSLPLSPSPSPDRPPLTEEPYTLGSSTSSSSSISDSLDPREGSPQHDQTASTTSNFDPPKGRVLQLIQSEQVPRYTKDATYVRNLHDDRCLMETPPSFPGPEKIGLEQDSLEEDCAPWVPATHPDGALYFFDKGRRLFTDTDMHDHKLRDEIERFYHYLQRILDHDGMVISSKKYDLTLDIMPAEDGQTQWSYYFACHETRCLFWLDPYDATYMISELFGVKSLAHIRHRLEDLYWTHWSLFPAVFEGRRLEPAVYDELVGILSHGCMDAMTSKSSTFPIRCRYNAEDDQTRLWLRVLIPVWCITPPAIRNKTIYADASRERTLLITLLSPVLFLAPEVHLRELETLWTDGVIIETVWKSFMTRLLDEWEELILSIFTSAAQIASCMSVEASVGSIVIGMLLVRHNRTKQKEDPVGASTYLNKNTHRIFGLEPMAIIFSLPWALLMWAISNLSTRIFVAVTSVMVAALIGWCIRSAWESGEERGAWLNSLLPSITRALGHVRARCRRTIDFTLRRENPSSLALGHVGSVRPIPDQRVEAVAV